MEKWEIKLSHLSTEVEVEVEDELGNIFTDTDTRRPLDIGGTLQLVLSTVN